MLSIRASNIIIPSVSHVVYSTTLLSREGFENRITVRLLFYESGQKNILPSPPRRPEIFNLHSGAICFWQKNGLKIIEAQPIEDLCSF